MVFTSIASAFSVAYMQRKLGIVPMMIASQIAAVVSGVVFYTRPSKAAIVYMDVLGEIAHKLFGVATRVLLLQVVDYDALVNGVPPRASTVAAMASCIEQAVYSLMDALPLTAMGSLGYVNNGGCQCGCGIRCNQPFLRWDCPRDRGYACSNALNKHNPVFFGDPTRVPPCTWQAPGVLNFVWWCNVVGAPLFACFSCWVLSRFTLAKRHDEVVEALEVVAKLKQVDSKAFDPVTEKIIEYRLKNLPTAIHTFDESDLLLIRSGTLARTLIRRIMFTVLIAVFTVVFVFFAKLNILQRTVGVSLVVATITYAGFSAVQLHTFQTEREVFMDHASRHRAKVHLESQSQRGLRHRAWRHSCDST